MAERDNLLILLENNTGEECNLVTLEEAGESPIILALSRLAMLVMAGVRLWTADVTQETFLGS